MECGRIFVGRAAVLFAWEQVGGAEAALKQAKEYAWADTLLEGR
ncbi:MAG: hypothetical protein Ct9H90mP27_2060 [Gammaproteobacteria bacterium]|nr:MAG: hypothetical protein Ct9H90mP27_2060 [Gammaproteobacteria bacterium]